MNHKTTTTKKQDGLRISKNKTKEN